jgi:hypothetical protein
VRCGDSQSRPELALDAETVDQRHERARDLAGT